MYLYKKVNGTLTQVASAIKATSNETLTYTGTAGEYALKVQAYAGSGNFDLYRKLP